MAVALKCVMSPDFILEIFPKILLTTTLSLKIAWIKRIQNEVTSSWKIIPDVMVQQYGNPFFFTRCNYDPKMLSLENLSSFYRSILVYWHDFKKSKQNEADFMNEILWDNRNILIDKKPVFYRRWFFPQHRLHT